MSDDPSSTTPLVQLWALIEPHLPCVAACKAADEGWLIDGVSVQLPATKENT
jgi:hypothetical protein